MGTRVCNSCGQPTKSSDKYCGHCGELPDEPRSRPFIVSPSKLAIMSFLTCGLYEIYWAYKQWRHLPGGRRRIGCFIRAVFSPITIYWLLKDLNIPRAGWIALLYIVLNVIPFLSDWLMYLSFAFIPLYIAQRHIEDKFHSFGQGGKYGTHAAIAIIIGMILWAVALGMTYGVI